MINMNDQNLKQLPLIKFLTTLVTQIIIASGVYFGFYFKTIYKLEEHDSRLNKVELNQNEIVKQLNLGILDNSVLSTKVDNMNENLKSVKEEQAATNMLLREMAKDIKNSN